MYMKRQWIIMAAFTLAAAVTTENGTTWQEGHTFEEGTKIDEDTYNALSEDQRVNCELVTEDAEDNADQQLSDEGVHADSENEEVEEAEKL